MNEKILLEAVVKAGELMLVSGAEVYRVEDTMKHMLAKSEYESAETIVYATGIFVTLSDPVKEPLTRVKRVPDRNTNINRIYRVNDVSRRFCAGLISEEEALDELKEIAKEVQYGPWKKALGLIGVSVFFTPIFGGGFGEFIMAVPVGMSLAAADWLVKRIRLNDFCVNAFCSFILSLSAMTVQNYFPKVSADVLIVGAIMPLVPGVTFTTAIRDTLNGDYAAGSARMLEAVVVALAVAVGVGTGLIFFNTMQGGLLC